MRLAKRRGNYPKNVPKKLLRLLRQYDGNRKSVSTRLGINEYYLSRLLNYGDEPTDKTANGQEVRLKLFLPRKKKRIKVSTIPKYIRPDFINKWVHLPKEERHKVIKQYLLWRLNNREEFK